MRRTPDKFSTLSHLQCVASSPITLQTDFSYFSHPLSPEVLRMFRSLKMLICSTCAMLHVPKMMNRDPEYRKDRMRQNRIKISLLNVSAYHCCIMGAQKPQTYYSQLSEFTFLKFHYPQRLKQRELMQKQKRPGRGPGKEKKKREGPVSIRKFAHPNLCTLGGVVCKLLQVPLQGMQLLGEPPGFRGKRRRKGS